MKFNLTQQISIIKRDRKNCLELTNRTVGLPEGVHLRRLLRFLQSCRMTTSRLLRICSVIIQRRMPLNEKGKTAETIWFSKRKPNSTGEF